MSGKKTTLAALVCALIFFPLGFTIGFRGGAESSEPESTVSSRQLGRADARSSPIGRPETSVVAPVESLDDEPGEPVETEAPPAPPSTGSLRVRVVWAETGDPAGDLRVFAVPLPRRSPSYERLDGVTGADGEVLFEGLPPGEFSVQSYRASAGRGGGRKRARILAGETAAVLLELPAGQTIDGVVVDSRDRPVAGAEIWLSQSDFDSTRSNLVTHADEDGRFSLLGVDQGRYISARAPGFSPSSQKVMSEWDREAVSVRLVLPGPGGAIEGLVVDDRKRPLRDAIVVIGEIEPTATHTTGPAPLTVRTDEEGLFAADGLPTGSVPIAVRARGRAPAEIVVDIAARRTARIEIVLEPGMVVHGRVFSASGEPVPDAKVWVGEKSDGYPSLDFLVTEVETRQDGRYRLTGLPSGSITVHASASDRGRTHANVDGAPGEELELDLELSGPLEIRGRVVSEDGTALRRAMVSPLGATTVFTDQDGRFVLRDLEEKGYQIRITERGQRFPCALLEDVLPGREEQSFTVAESARATAHITGRVLGPDGSAVRGAEVSCLGGPIRDRSQTKSGFFGGFRVGPLPPGTYELGVSSGDFPTVWSEKITVRQGETGNAGDLRLREPGFIKIAFSSADPRAADGLFYAVLDADGRRLAGESLAAESTARDRVIPGTHRLVIRGDGVEIEREVTVVVHEETVLEIELPSTK